MATKIRRDWSKIDPLIDNLKAQGWNDTQIAKDLGIGRQTLVDHLRSRAPVHPSTPEHSGVPQEHLNLPDSAHPSTPEGTESLEHPGTLEAHQEVLEDISESVPDAPHIGTEGADQDTPEHPSTPIVHPEVSPNDSTLAHSGVPARQEPHISPPMVRPGTPTEEDWMLWTAMKGRWAEIEKMLTAWQSRQAFLSTPSGTPRHTMKKTYVVERLYIEFIDRYAQEQGVELKDVVNLAFHEFFERREYLPRTLDEGARGDRPGGSRWVVSSPQTGRSSTV
jgi:hypothetical protein